MKNKSGGDVEKLEQEGQVFEMIGKLASKFNMDLAKDFSVDKNKDHSLQDKMQEMQKILTKLSPHEQEFFKNMGGFVDSYYDIFCFSKEKIEQELHVILDYYLNDLDNFDVLNIDLVDNAKTFVERKKKREAYLKSLDPARKKVVEEILENYRKNRRSLVSKDDNLLTDQEKEVFALIDKFKIFVNRHELGIESMKGYNKCKDNDLAFIQHKQGTLFPRKGVQDYYQISQERKAIMEDLSNLIKRIQNDSGRRREVYDRAYNQHISPRMSSLSPNSSFMSLNKLNGKSSKGANGKGSDSPTSPLRYDGSVQRLGFDLGHPQIKLRTDRPLLKDQIDGKVQPFSSNMSITEHYIKDPSQLNLKIKAVEGARGGRHYKQQSSNLLFPSVDKPIISKRYVN